MVIKKRLFNLCFCAIMISLSTVLSMVKLFQMPLGGDVTLCSMLPVMMISWFLGMRYGLVSALLNSVIQAMISFGTVSAWGLSPQALAAAVLIDYIAAYTVIGLCGIFRTNNCASFRKFLLGMLLAVSLRLCCHFISGIVLFSSWATFQPVWLYSISYNGLFLLPDLALCAIAAAISFKQLTKLMSQSAK